MMAINRQSPNHSGPLERCNRRNRPPKNLLRPNNALPGVRPLPTAGN